MKPVAAGNLLSLLLAETPPRLVKKLESQPQLAEEWRWENQEQQWLVTTSQGEKVRLELRQGVLQSLEDLSCSCLLAPRCLHRLAVLSLLPVGVESSSEPEGSTPGPAFGLSLSQEQRKAAEDLFAAGSRVLQVGAEGCGLVEQGEIQRVAFQCRQHGLHRGAAAAARLLSSLRWLRDGKSEFSQAELAGQLRELLEVGLRLQQQPLSLQWLGQARRTYQPAGALKLWGLFSEAVVTASGYAGCVTYLCDRHGKVFNVSDVAPGSWERAQQAYRAGTTLPGLSIGHQQLSRRVLLIQSATVSPDGRLGSGQAVSAAITGASLWSEPELQALWLRPWERQLAEQDLLFLEASVLGVEREALILEKDSLPLRLVVSGLPEGLPARDNLALLGRAPAAPLRWIARLHPSLERTLVGLAVAGPFPQDWEGRANLGLDRLMGAYFPNLQVRPRELASQPALLPWSGLERLLWRLAQAGRSCAHPDEPACRVWLEHRLEGAVRLWRALVAQAQSGSRDLRGHWLADSGPGLALHWLAAMLYLEKGRQTWLRECWSQFSEGPAEPD
ncbi:SWIM zinc finger family protein [bacterium]|nr:SWIM zinc finger family protein [bacterium]